LLVLIAGITVRVVQWAVSVPIYGDQAALGVDLQSSSYSALAGPLKYNQVAPVGFLWIERAVLNYLGPSERMMRLPSTLAGIAALPMVYLLCRRFADKSTAILAAAILSASTFCIRHSVEIKPYGIDFLCAAMLYFLAAGFIQQRQIRWLAALVAVAPVALLISYPSMIVVISIALTLAICWRSLDFRGRVYTVALCSLSLHVYLLILRPVMRAQASACGPFMRGFWRDHFPPANPLKLIAWLMAMHTGSLFVYPIEGDTPWCAPGLLFFLFGIVAWMRGARRPLVLLVLLPFAINLATAALRLYPYGEARLSQHLAPLIIVFTAMGTLALVSRILRSERRVNGFLRFAFISLSLAALMQIFPEIRSVMRPAESQRLDYEIRDFMRGRLTEIGPAPAVVLMGAPPETPHGIEWYARAGGSSFAYNALPRPTAKKSPPLWVFFPTHSHTADEISRQVGRPVAAHYVLNGTIGQINAFEVVGFVAAG
jgi:hypothetical protein